MFGADIRGQIAPARCAVSETKRAAGAQSWNGGARVSNRNTPWGRADQIEQVGAGIYFASGLTGNRFVDTQRGLWPRSF
jgi:hypothetical protein